MAGKRKYTDYSKYGTAIGQIARPATRTQLNEIARLSAQDAKDFRILMSGRPMTKSNVRDALAMIREGNLELELYFLPQPREEYPTPQCALRNAM